LTGYVPGRLPGLEPWAGGVPPAIGFDGDGRAAAEGGAGAGARGGELDFNTRCRAAGSSDNSRQDSRDATFWPGRVARHFRPAWTLCPREAQHSDGNGCWSTFRRAVNRSMRVLQFVAAS